MSIDFVPEGTVEVPEIPYKEEVVLPAAGTAVIVVDMQNDFVNPDGALPVPAAKETVPHIQRLLASAREKNVRIVYTQDTQVPGDPEFDIWPEHCLQGTWGWEIIDELKPEKDDLVCPKNRYDAFYESWLDHFLTRIWQVKHLVIVGTVSNICVAHTAASAGLRWFHIVVPAHGISALNNFDQALTLRQASGLYAGDVVKNVDQIRFETN
jgi:nicotinamidase-related amidase